MSSERIGVRPDPSIIPLDERHTERAKQLWETYFGVPDDHADNWLHDARIDTETPTQGFVAVRGTSLLGFGIATDANRGYAQEYFSVDIDIDLWERTGILHIIVVDEQYEGQGIGSDLVRARLRWLRNVTEVGGVMGVSWHREDHVDSRVLFEKFGFEAVETVEEYYAKSEEHVPCVDCEGSCRCDATIYRKAFGGGGSNAE